MASNCLAAKVKERSNRPEEIQPESSDQGRIKIQRPILPRMIADNPLVLPISPSKIHLRCPIAWIETFLDAMHQNQQSRRILPKLRIKSHEIPMKRVLILLTNKVCTRLFIEIENASSQSSLMRGNSQGFQSLEIGPEPDTKRPLIGFCRNLFDFPSQLFDLIFMTVTVDVRLPEKSSASRFSWRRSSCLFFREMP